MVVAVLQTGRIRRAARDDVRDGDSRLHAVDTSDCWNLLRGKLYADRPAGQAVLRLDELVLDVNNLCGGNREPDSRVGIGFRKNGGFNPDDFAGHVYQRSTRVAGIDRRIGLNKRLELTVRDNVAA